MRLTGSLLDDWTHLERQVRAAKSPKSITESDIKFYRMIFEFGVSSVGRELQRRAGWHTITSMMVGVSGYERELEAKDAKTKAKVKMVKGGKRESAARINKQNRKPRVSRRKRSAREALGRGDRARR
jgi:hypothetical protein